MVNPLLVLTDYTYLFILIVLRYAGLFIVTPILSSGAYPRRMKAAAAFWLAVATAPVIANSYEVVFPDHPLLVAGDVLRELSIGLVIGFLVLLIFSSIQLAGQVIDIKMGFLIVNVFDPVSDVQGPVTGQFKNILASILFLTINGHLMLIRALYSTYNTLPPGEMIIAQQGWQLFFRAAGDIFIIAFMIALPVVGTIFMTDIIFGFLARSIPQINIFIVGLPFKILIGVLILLLSTTMFMQYFVGLFENAFSQIAEMIEYISP